MSKLKFLLLLLTPLFLFALSGKVIKVTDGDTIKILTPANEQVKIRLYGIDAPEKKQPFGRKSKEFLAGLIVGKFVEIEEHGKDRYKRTLGVVYYGDEDINAKMVSSGYAWAFVRYSDRYEKQENFAKRQKLGLWQDKNPIPPCVWRMNENKSKLRKNNE